MTPTLNKPSTHSLTPTHPHKPQKTTHSLSLTHTHTPQNQTQKPNEMKQVLLELYRISLSSAPLPLERYITNFVCEVPLPPQVC